MTVFNFDNSLLKDYCNCIAMAVAKHVHGLRGKGEKIAADIGNAYHFAMEHFFRRQPKDVVVGVFEQAYDRIIKPGEYPEEERFAKGNCVKILERFCDVKKVDSFPFEMVETERVKGIEIEEGYVFWVRRDMLVKEKATGLFAVVDHKTTGRLTDWFARNFRLASQLTGYSWFTQQETGQIVGSVYVNGIEVAKLPDSNRKCSVHKVPYYECGGKHANFQLYHYIRTPEQVEKWLQDVKVLMKQVKRMFEGFVSLHTLPYAMRNGSFNEHCRFCEMAKWCRQGFSMQTMEDYVVVDPWKPWEKGERVDG